MKIYEKPMTVIEKIEVEDVMMGSPPIPDMELELRALGQNETTDVILFEW